MCREMQRHSIRLRGLVESSDSSVWVLIPKCTLTCKYTGIQILMLCIVDMLLTEIIMPDALKYTYSHVLSTYI